MRSLVLAIALIMMLSLAPVFHLQSVFGNDSTDIAWENTTSLPVLRDAHSSVVARDYLYVIGGDDEINPPSCPPAPFPNVSCAVNTVFFAEIRPDGTVGTWSLTTSLPDLRAAFIALTFADRIYVIGGHRFDGFAAGQTTAFFCRSESRWNARKLDFDDLLAIGSFWTRNSRIGR